MSKNRCARCGVLMGDNIGDLCPKCLKIVKDDYYEEGPEMIKIGELVLTKSGYVLKITGVNREWMGILKNGVTYYDFDKNFKGEYHGKVICENNIIKHGFDLRDVLSVGDIIIEGVKIETENVTGFEESFIIVDDTYFYNSMSRIHTDYLKVVTKIQWYKSAQDLSKFK